MIRLLQLLVLAGPGAQALKALIGLCRSRACQRSARRRLFRQVQATGGSAPLEEAPADTAAKCYVGELALAVLAPAGPPQLAVLSHLYRRDKLNLGATCTSLQQASLAWFQEVNVGVKPGKTHVASLTAWLVRHQAQLNLTLHGHASTNASWVHLVDAREWVVAALPSHMIISLTAHEGLPAAGSTLTALTSLSLAGSAFDERHVNLLKPLSQLRQLSMKNTSVASTVEKMLALPALKELQELQLHNCRLWAVPCALTALTRLTSLDLSYNSSNAGTRLLAALPRLQNLGLRHYKLTAVPRQVSTLTCLTRLDLADNAQLADGWQRLVPLNQLQDLNLSKCSLIAVPHHLSALTALNHLDLSHNKHLAAGWQHLVSLTRLRRLDLRRVHLESAQMPARKAPYEQGVLPQLRVIYGA